MVCKRKCTRFDNSHCFDFPAGQAGCCIQRRWQGEEVLCAPICATRCIAHGRGCQRQWPAAVLCCRETVRQRCCRKPKDVSEVLWHWSYGVYNSSAKYYPTDRRLFMFGLSVPALVCVWLAFQDPSLHCHHFFSSPVWDCHRSNFKRHVDKVGHPRGFLPKWHRETFLPEVYVTWSPSSMYTSLGAVCASYWWWYTPHPRYW